MIDPLTELLYALMISWFVLLAVVIGIRILHADIHVTGLLAARKGGPRDPERVALMFATLFVLGAYTLEVLSSGAQCQPDMTDCRMPDIPETLLLILAGGNSTYLAGKLVRKPF